MYCDEDFLRQLLANPADDATRLVYADWLEEQGGSGSEAKAEFLRMTAQLGSDSTRKKQKKKRRERLQQLAAGLDTTWLAVVSRLPIENCLAKRRTGGARLAATIRFEFLCDRGWQDLRTTEDRAVRFCEGCKQYVHYCDTITDARKHAWAGHCVAVDLGVIRRDRDLQRPRMLLGKISPDGIRREEELLKPDPVSAEREQRKQGRAGEGGSGGADR